MHDRNMPERPYWLRCYPADPAREGQTVDQHVLAAHSPWHALEMLAMMLRWHPAPFQPVRIDIFTEQPPDWLG